MSETNPIISNKITKAEFLDLVQQALDEVQDLFDAVEYDQEFMQESLNYISPLQQELREIKQNISGGGNLSSKNFQFVELIKNISPAILPFKGLLNRINQAEIV